MIHLTFATIILLTTSNIAFHLKNMHNHLKEWNHV